MPFKLSIKYHTLPKRLADKYQRILIFNESYDTYEEALEYVGKHFYSIKNDIYTENEKWKIRLYLFQFPSHIYNTYVHTKKIKIFDTEEEAKKYADNNVHTYLYLIEYTTESVNLIEI
jgi:hypothetical protein